MSIVSLRAHVHNAMFIIARAADSRFSHGRRQLPFKSVQWAKPLLTLSVFSLNLSSAGKGRFMAGKAQDMCQRHTLMGGRGVVK